METYGSAPAAVPAPPTQTVAQQPDALRQQIAQQQVYLRDQADSERAAKAFIKREIAVMDESLSVARAAKWEDALPWAAGGTILGLIVAALLKGK